MLGEVGLDGGARMRWPKEARDLYPERHPQSTDKGGGEANEGKGIIGEGGNGAGEKREGHGQEEEEEGEWRRLTPFKVSMEHQREILERQLEIAVEEGVNVSLHSVAAAGKSYPTASKSILLHDFHPFRPSPISLPPVSSKRNLHILSPDELAVPRESDLAILASRLLLMSTQIVHQKNLF